MHQMRFTAVAAGDVAALGFFRGDAERTLRGLPRLGQWFATAGADRVAAALAETALWLAAGWLALGLLAAAGSRMPGAAGRGFGALARAVLPRALRGLAVGTTGVGVLLAPVCATAAPLMPGPASPVHRAGTPASSVSAPLPSPGWPAAPSAGQPRRDTATRPAADAPPDMVTVRRGDSLWLLATRRLHAAGEPATAREVAATWPRWYAANRAAIGPDPDVLRPGQRLTAPPSGPGN